MLPALFLGQDSATDLGPFGGYPILSKFPARLEAGFLTAEVHGGVAAIPIGRRRNSGGNQGDITECLRHFLSIVPVKILKLSGTVERPRANRKSAWRKERDVAVVLLVSLPGVIK